MMKSIFATTKSGRAIPITIKNVFVPTTEGTIVLNNDEEFFVINRFDREAVRVDGNLKKTRFRSIRDLLGYGYRSKNN